MALNPPLTFDGCPIRLDGEYFLRDKDKTEIEAIITNGGKRTANGKLHLTSARLVFVSKDYHQDSFKAFDIPMTNILVEKFEKPFFGSNYLELTVKPLYGLLPGITTMKIWFKKGKGNKMYKAFKRVVNEAKTRRYSGDEILPSQKKSVVKADSKAFVDPRDPMLLYVPSSTELTSCLEEIASQNKSGSMELKVDSEREVSI